MVHHVTMKLIDKLFPSRNRDRTGTEFRTVAEWSPTFAPWSGDVYGQALTRRAIESFATACSKLKPYSTGTAQPMIQRAFRTSPSKYQTWPAFLYRCATVFEVDTTLAVLPVFGADVQTYTGIYPVRFTSAEVFTVGDEPWVRFTLPSGDRMAIELSKVAFVSKYQYESDIFGTDNVLDSTMRLIDAQEQAQDFAIKNGAKIRWIGAVDGLMDPDDVDDMRSKFSEENLSDGNESGLLIYDSRFRDLKEVDPKSYTIDAEEMERIQNNVYDYFGTNELIIQNKYDEDVWDAYYEGKVEPFGLALGESLSHMLFTQRERANNWVSFSSNRLEYSSNASKRNMIRDMLDRGVISINEAREILQLPPVPDGDRFVIRGEYIDARLLSQHTIQQAVDAKTAEDAQMDDTELPEDDYDYLMGDKVAQGDGSDRNERQ